MRRKALRRPLALLLAFVLCIGMLPAPALAQEADGESQPLADLDGVHDSWEQDSATVVTDDAVCEVTGEGKLHLKAGSGNWTGTNGKDAPPAMFVNHTASDALKAAGDGEKFLEMTITPISSKEHTRVGVYLNYTDPGNGFFIGFDATGWLYQLYNGGDGHFERSGVGAPEAGTDVTLRLEWTGTNLTKATANDQTIFENVDFSAANNSAEGVVAFKAGGETEAGIPSEVYLTGITYTGQQESPADETAPKLVSAEMTGLDTAVLKFDEALEKTSAETAGNYTCEAESGVTVTAAALAADGVTVTLTLEGLAAGATATLTISGVKDLAGNAAESITAELTGLEESATSYLKENERIVPYDEWCTSGMDIPVVFAQGDNVASIKDGEVGLTQGSDYSVYVEEGTST